MYFAPYASCFLSRSSSPILRLASPIPCPVSSVSVSCPVSRVLSYIYFLSRLSHPVSHACVSRVSCPSCLLSCPVYPARRVPRSRVSRLVWLALRVSCFVCVGSSVSYLVSPASCLVSRLFEPCKPQRMPRSAGKREET